jgi:methyl-accepting chemotaxis protein
MFKNLRIWHKFALIALFFCFPIAYLLYSLWTEASTGITFARAELDGTEYWRPLRKLISDLQSHRDLAAAVLAGDASFKAELDKAEAAIDEDFRAVEAADARFAVEFGDHGKAIDKIRSAWTAVKGSYAGQKPEQSFQSHTQVVLLAMRFISLVGNASNLILDPDVDTHYLQDHYVFRNLKLTEEVSQSRAVGIAFIASGAQGDENTQRKFQLAAASVRIDDALIQVNETIVDAMRFNKHVEVALKEPLEGNTRATHGFAVALNEKMVNSTAPLAAREFWTMATATLNVQASLAQAALEELDKGLGARILRLVNSRMKEIGVSAALVALTLLLMLAVIRSITRPIAHLSQIADRISLGEMDAKIDIESHDEIGELGERFRRLQVSLKAAMDQLEGVGQAEG